MQSLTAGQSLAGRFRLIRSLGRGGISEVWLAEDTDNNRQFALKFPMAASAHVVSIVRAEFELARRLIHPGIVRVHEFVNGSPTFMVMQYVDGTNLGVLRGAGFRTILKAMIPVAEALEYAHRQGVIHRDLKPSNVLCDSGGRCLVADFGLGAFASGGSPPGMSPQQLDGEPPAPSDDVYGFGALLYDLLVGQPLFHPDPTPDRIRHEMPVTPAVDLSGEPLPAGLRQLLGAMLQKAAEQRPPGLGAVRNALEELLRDAKADSQPGEAASPPVPHVDVIRPRERARQPSSAVRGAPGMSTAPQGRLFPARRGLPAAAVFGGIGLLALAAVLVIFYLPAMVRERGPLVSVATQPAPVTETGAHLPPAGTQGPGSPPVSQEILDKTLGEFLRSDDDLRKLGADKWGGADWAELRRLAAAGDDALKVRDSATALTSYRDAAALAKRMIAGAPEVLAEALRLGAAALNAGDQANAITQFEKALTVDANNENARHGLERARKLDQVLTLMRQASAAESAGQRTEALRLYRQAAALDSAWSAAGAGISRLEQAAAREIYETQMARGFAAQAGKDLPAARAAFEAALRVRPGDAEARSALDQIDSDLKTDGLAALQAQARSLEQAERWADALQRYEAALAGNANLAEARSGQERARARLDLDQRLRRELGNAERFNDDAVLQKARTVLESARAIPDPGPVLTQQIGELEHLLQVAATPVRVTLESDNVTEITLFKVGRLGAFSSRTLELRPGSYTAMGIRPGYRDVRRSFRVSPGSDSTPIVVRCEEPI